VVDYVKFARILAKNPFAFLVFLLRIRRGFLDKYPYAVYYKVNENKKTVEIMAVIHTSRGEEYIEKSLKYT
jgi:plasmid stabilization system protein ParE